MYLISNQIEIKSITKKQLFELWSLAYNKSADLSWRKYDDPYIPNPLFLTWDSFQADLGERMLENPHCGLIYFEGKIIGLVTAYWKDGQLQRWLEVGIVIYDHEFRNRGIGEKSLRLWITYLFQLHLHIKHIGLSTWSGNYSMIQLANKLKLIEESCIPQVRFYRNNYYDALQYGILKDDWQKLNNL